MNKSLLPLLGLLALALLPTSGSAYVSGAASAGPGEWDSQVRWSYEYGLLGNQNIPESQIRSKASIREYALRFGKNFGEVAGIPDFSVHLNGSYYENGAESLNGVTTYAKDQGYWIGGEASGNFVHEPDKKFGWFIRLGAPVSLKTEKFGKTRLDTVGLGLQGGVNLTDFTSLEGLSYYGSGYRKDGVREQNASLVNMGLVGFRVPKLVASGAVIKLGPFFESDLTERDDPVYNLSGFRGFRVGLTGIAQVTLTPNWGLELGYVHKLSGAYFRATKDVFLSVGTVF